MANTKAEIIPVDHPDAIRDHTPDQGNACVGKLIAANTTGHSVLRCTEPLQMKHVLSVCLFLWSISAAAQTDNNRFKLTGTVTDAQSGEKIAGAVVQLRQTFIGAMTNAEGEYTITKLKAGTYTAVFHMLGYSDVVREVAVTGNTTLHVSMNPLHYIADEVIVNATRADSKSGIAFTTVDRKTIEQQNTGQDVPYLLETQPSVVVNSDAGAGVGYTGIRIRGTDATRINVSINGIPVNDAESQGMFWVDMPDLLSSTDNIQVQRGAGTSTNGAGAFGGTINLQTSGQREKAYSEVIAGYGSFNTRRVSFLLGTGLLDSCWAIDGRFSTISSDGYIDRASSDLRSWYLSGGYYGKNATVKLVTFSGNEKTYQAWNGVPESYLDTNRTFNPSGRYTDANGNVRYYENETDNYRQDYYQLHYSQRLGDRWHLNTSLHYTRGYGYYENFKEDATLNDYIQFIDTVIYSDAIIRRWLDNHFYGLVWSANYASNKKLQLHIGGGAHQYLGDHFGELIWSTYPFNDGQPFEYYRNDAVKNDANIYTKAIYKPTARLSLFGDLQLRYVGYNFDGFDAAGLPTTQDATLLFFNPKAGLNFDITDKHSVYISGAVANKEPNRNDYVESTTLSRPKHETLYDGEAGWKMRTQKLQLGANLYYMLYKNQLVLTGKINDVGAYTRTNVDHSYRAGVELEAGVQLHRTLTLSANTTLSSNKIRNYTEYADDYDTGEQLAFFYPNTDIAFSPAAIAAGVLTWTPCKGCTLAVTEKYVGRQFLDNSGRTDRSINPYAITGLRAAYAITFKNLRELSITGQVNNLLNKMYEANGYTFSYQYGGTFTTENYYFPQAGVHFMSMVTLKF